MSSKIIKSFGINYFTQDQSSFVINQITCLNRDYPLINSSFRANFYVVVIVASGVYTICINEFEYSDLGDSIYVIKPGDIVSMRFGSNCTGVFLGFEDAFFSQRYHENVLKYFDFFQLDSIPQQFMVNAISVKINMLTELMLTEYGSTRVYRIKVLRSYLNILLCELQYIEGLTDVLHIDYGKSSSNDRILAFLDLVEVYFKEAKTPSFYAEKLCVTPNYLNKLCKQERGVTAGQVVRQRIIIEAKRLLQFSSFNINEIARELCFDSTSYFVTFFKKQEGITPESYRKTFA
ncbi:helix-turn-helix domain-containing protein [Myroides sp. M-43]|uniref:helix-turn-helix domain-containing protein n=1 Tax=Myroides oncorhynchi TaxID=2893756 RepID=UPI001E33C1E6|nr:helix-turn-helix domain-containing protein [Myroides oncorhynchi]MCC9041798.1 helix-turn-helix domain-containing protein [Myroides oncorhynchi]